MISVASIAYKQGLFGLNLNIYQTFWLGHNALKLAYSKLQYLFSRGGDPRIPAPLWREGVYLTRKWMGSGWDGKGSVTNNVLTPIFRMKFTP